LIIELHRGQMSAQSDSKAPGYDSAYREFDSPLMRQLRQEAYDEDIGQHSWVVAAELRADIARLGLSRASRFLDLGCGPCGPLTFILNSVGCRGTGMELSAAALAVGRMRAAALGVEHLMTVHEADLNKPLPIAARSFDAVMALDVVLHLQDRAQLFREVARTLASGGRFLFTDAGVVTGSLSDQEVLARSVHGYTQFVAPGFNERTLDSSGFRLLETEDRTESVLNNATGRLVAMVAHRAEFEELKGVDDFERQQRYLETVVALSQRRAVSRLMYLAEASAV
jgi:SAM-dependent methyltransferase